MCEEAVRDYLLSLQHVTDRFVTQEQIDLWYDDKYIYNDHRMIEWYKCYKKRKAQKASIKKRVNAYCLASIKVMGLVCS